jgi:hypothetical protein
MGTMILLMLSKSESLSSEFLEECNVIKGYFKDCRKVIFDVMISSWSSLLFHRHKPNTT